LFIRVPAFQVWRGTGAGTGKECEGAMERQIRLLLLDDEPIVGKRLVPALAKLGIETESFTDPEAALQQIARKDFDIVVTDFRMDKMDGMEVLRRVLQKSPRTKVIIITGYATLEIARQALAIGAFDFIAKPFKPNDLRNIVAKAARALGYKIKEKLADSSSAHGDSEMELSDPPDVSGR
jgi:DNA-binding NtrC family response regulator